MKFFYQENLFNYLMLAAFVQADISTEKSSYLTEFQNWNDHLLKLFREQSSVESMRLRKKDQAHFI